MNFKTRHILIDTCIFNNLHSKQTELANKTATLLASLIENGNRLYFSEFTRHELLRGATSPKRLKIESSLNLFLEVHSTPQRIERATQLFNSYKHGPVKPIDMHSPSDIDLFIGALIFTHNHPLLLTADYNDFPRPFFTEKHIERIEFQKKGNTKQSLYYYFLQANLKTI